MSVNLLGAQYKNRNTAGVTASKTDETEHQVSPAQTSSESIAAHISSAVGSLGELMSGGIHPESGIPTAVDTALQKGSGIVGKLGGLIPDRRAPQTSVIVGKQGPPDSTAPQTGIGPLEGPKGPADGVRLLANDTRSVGNKIIERIKRL
jgi:hypothetical protein